MRRNPSDCSEANRALALVVLVALSLAGCAKEEEPAPPPAPSAPIVVEPVAAGNSESDLGQAAENAVNIRPNLTPRPPEDEFPPQEAQVTPPEEPASGPSGESG